MAIRRRTADEVVSTDAKELPPEGFYPVAVSGLEVKTTQATQDMIILKLMLLAIEGDPASAMRSLTVDHVVLPDTWSDEQAFRDDKREKLAKKHGVSISKITDAQVEEAVATATRMGEESMYRTARAIVGDAQLPPVPKWDPEVKKFVDSEGNYCDKAAKDEARRAQVASAIDTFADIVEGELDVHGYVCYAKIVHNEFNGFKSLKTKGLYEKLPDDAVLLTP